jgi:methylated-DNA-[protein]-cysteine S-methyltransferase
MATEFESLVYEKTMEIPQGRVTTYRELARAIGRPGAVRAVGNALNKNPTPTVVPCHRVVRSDLSIGGFARGSEEKIRLLKIEGVEIEDSRLNGRVLWVWP